MEYMVCVERKMGTLVGAEHNLCMLFISVHNFMQEISISPRLRSPHRSSKIIIVGNYFSSHSFVFFRAFFLQHTMIYLLVYIF